MLLNSAIENAVLHVNAQATAMSGSALEMLARHYMEVQAIMRRWARRYDERLLEQLIYLPAVRRRLDHPDFMRDWIARSKPAQRAHRWSAALSRRAAHGLGWSFATHRRAQNRTRTGHREAAASGILRIGRVSAHCRAGTHTGRLIGEGAYIARATSARRSAPSKSHGVAV